MPVRRPRQGDPGRRCARSTVSSGTATCRRWSRASATATACTARTTPPRACGATRTSCSSTPTPRPSTDRCGGTRRCSATRSATRTATTTADSAPFVPKSVVVNPFFDWGSDRHPRIPYHETMIYEAHVKGLTITHPEIPAELRGTYSGVAHPVMIEHLKRLGVTAVELMPVHEFITDHHLQEKELSNYWGYNTIAFLAPHHAYAQPSGRPGSQVQEFKAMVRDLHQRGHRGDPRRGLQPHRRGQPHGPDAVHARHRQRRLLPPRRRRPALLHGLHGHGQLAERAQPAHAAADHGLAALLGHRDARRRLPVRPRVHAGPRVLRRRPAVGVLRPRPAGPGDQSGEAHRRAVGRRAGWVPGGQLPAAVDGVERQVPRHRARLLAGRARHARRVRLPPHRQLGPLPGRRPPPVRVDQLRHRARRVHAQRPRLVQREAQRGQRRGQQRRREPQPLVELRGGGPHGRRRDPGAARPPAAQLHHDPVPDPRRADGAARRRDGPHAARQQQRLRPGQRDRVDGLVARRQERGADRVHRGRLGAARRDIRCSGAAGSSTGKPINRARPQGRAHRPAGHRLVHPGRPGDDRAGLGLRLRQVRHGVPERAGHHGGRRPG